MMDKFIFEVEEYINGETIEFSMWNVNDKELRKGKGEILIERNRAYILQNEMSGDTPNNSWDKSKYRYSWFIGQVKKETRELYDVHKRTELFKIDYEIF